MLANSEDTDQSDLGLHCLPMSQRRDARLICVNVNIRWSSAGYSSCSLGPQFVV